MIGIKWLILSITVMYIGRFIISVLSPDRYKPLIKSSTSILILGVIASGILGFELKLDDISSINLDSIRYNNQGDELLLSDLNNKLEAYIEDSLKNNGIQIEKAEISTTIDEDRCISISKIVIYIDSSQQNNMEAIDNYIANTIGDFPVEIISSVE